MARPLGSKVRQNMVEILYYAKQLHGYDIYAIYKQVFPMVTLRAIYYHLKKGTDIGEFKIAQIKKEQGTYSWGTEVERIYYALGPAAKPAGNPLLRERIIKGYEATRKQSSA